MVKINKTINDIVKNRNRCFFISPHQDDAVFSAGGLISYLSNKTEVIIINVFDGCGSGPYTLSAKAFLKQCAYQTMSDLSTQRYSEDAEVAKRLNVALINLDFDDAQYRKKISNSMITKIIGKVVPEILHIYPIYRINIRGGKISVEDRELIKEINRILKSIISKKSDIIFCPISVGGHVDHKIVKKVITDNFKNNFFWMDYPYIYSDIKNRDIRDVLNQKYSCFTYDPDWREKELLIKGYKSQYNAIFKYGIKRITEMYFRFK